MAVFQVSLNTSLIIKKLTDLFMFQETANRVLHIFHKILKAVRIAFDLQVISSDASQFVSQYVYSGRQMGKKVPLSHGLSCHVQSIVRISIVEELSEACKSWVQINLAPKLIQLKDLT